MKITDEEYEEYQNLKRWAKREKIVVSAKEITRLEDDIDLPIKNCVAMFALMGCRPVFSCCGFDYSGQPIHKSHQYGRPYFILTANASTYNVLYNISLAKTFWHSTPNTRNFVNLELWAGMNPHWRKEECIHFSEECVLEIQKLERLLWHWKDFMVEEFTLEDSNGYYEKNVRNWQYPAKESWVIRKLDYMKLHES